jgi:hypothetical protein
MGMGVEDNGIVEETGPRMNALKVLQEELERPDVVGLGKFDPWTSSLCAAAAKHATFVLWLSLKKRFSEIHVLGRMHFLRC